MGGDSAQVIELESSSDEGGKSSRPAKRARVSESPPSAAKRIVELQRESTTTLIARLPTLDEQELQLLQAALVRTAGGADGEEKRKAQEVLPHVQRAVVMGKLERMRGAKEKESARQELITKKLAGESEDVFRIELKRGGASPTTAVCRRVWGNCESLRKADINFTLRIPFNQAAEKFSNAIAALAIMSAPAEFIEYFNSRSRAGVAVIEARDIEVCLLPAGPVARALIGVETLTRDDALGKLPLLLTAPVV